MVLLETIILDKFVMTLPRDLLTISVTARLKTHCRTGIVSVVSETRSVKLDARTCVQ